MAKVKSRNLNKHMNIQTQFDHKGKTYKVTYTDGTPLVPTHPAMLDGVHAYCFYGNKLVVVGHGNNEWTPPGGGIEKGETYEQASIREIKEESNMKVVHQECIGYQDVELPEQNRIIQQFRMFCIVEPYGDFESDPDGDIFEIKLIDPTEYKEYIPWGEVGDHLIQRVLEMKQEYEKNI